MDKKKTTRHSTEKSTRKHQGKMRRESQGAAAAAAKKVDPAAKKPAAKLNSKWRNVRENISTISQQTGRAQEKLQIEVMYGENFGDGLTFPEITSTYDSFRPTVVRRRPADNAMLKRMRSVKTIETVKSAAENHKQDISEESVESTVETLPPIEAAPLADIVEAEESPPPLPPTPPLEEAGQLTEKLSVRFDDDDEEEVFTEEDSQHVVRILDIKNFSKSVDLGGRDEDNSKEEKKRFLSLPDLDIRGAFNLIRMNSLDGSESPKVSSRRPSLTDLRGETSSRVAGVRNLVRSLTEGNINRLGVHSPMPDRLPKKELPKRKFIQLENLANFIDTMDGGDSAIGSLSDSMYSLEVSTIADDQFRCQDFVEDSENCFAQYDPKTNEFTRLATPTADQQKKERQSNRHLSRIAENAEELLSIGTIDSASRSSLRSSALDGLSESRSIQPPRLSFAELKKAAQSKVERMNYLKTFETRTIRSQLSSSALSGEPIEPIEWKQGKVIDRGAFGTVYQGLTNDAKLIAVKEVFFNKSKDIATQKLRLEKEVEILKGLQHPNIVQFQGTCSMDDRVQIFMNYVAGGTLSSLMNNFGPLSEQVYKRFTQQIMSAVAYIHSKGVVHRDIKGANILIEPRGTVKLIDFGCSREMSLSRGGKDSSLMKSMKGTPFWMAPEVIRGTGCNHKSDIWSVGCTVIEMASGKPPWSEAYDNATAIMFAIGSGNVVDPILPEDSSTEARDFVAKCITRKMDDRPSAEDLLSHPFIDYRNQSLF